MESIYREQILDHYKFPRHNGQLDPADRSFAADNPLCGDRIRIDMRLDDERVIEANFSGDGCAISQAAASMLMELVQGKTLAEVRQISREDVLEMLGIELSAARLKCALLSLKVLKVGAYGLQEWVED